MDILLLRADITSLKVDAIVNATSALMKPDGRVVVREGGRLVEKSNDDIPPLTVGSAVATTGGNLLCRFIIHAVVPRMGEGDEDAKLRAATWSALQRAEELAIGSVGLPAMSAGTFGFTFERCARIMLGTTLDFRRQARSLDRAVYCLFGKEPYDIFERVLKELEG
jgi:O-acetyl-ADP-ribose deacetylase (regulator of RNase III)